MTKRTREKLFYALGVPLMIGLVTFFATEVYQSIKTEPDTIEYGFARENGEAVIDTVYVTNNWDDIVQARVYWVYRESDGSRTGPISDIQRIPAKGNAVTFTHPEDWIHDPELTFIQIGIRAWNNANETLYLLDPDRTIERLRN